MLTIEISFYKSLKFFSDSLKQIKKRKFENIFSQKLCGKEMFERKLKKEGNVLQARLMKGTGNGVYGQAFEESIEYSQKCVKKGWREAMVIKLSTIGKWWIITTLQNLHDMKPFKMKFINPHLSGTEKSVNSWWCLKKFLHKVKYHGFWTNFFDWQCRKNLEEGTLSCVWVLARAC